MNELVNTSLLNMNNQVRIQANDPFLDCEEEDVVEGRIMAWLDSFGIRPDCPSTKMEEYFEKKRLSVFRIISSRLGGTGSKKSGVIESRLASRRNIPSLTESLKNPLSFSNEKNPDDPSSEKFIKSQAGKVLDGVAIGLEASTSHHGQELDLFTKPRDSCQKSLLTRRRAMNLGSLEVDIFGSSILNRRALSIPNSDGNPQSIESQVKSLRKDTKLSIFSSTQKQSLDNEKEDGSVSVMNSSDSKLWNSQTKREFFSPEEEQVAMMTSSLLNSQKKSTSSSEIESTLNYSSCKVIKASVREVSCSDY